MAPSASTGQRPRPATAVTSWQGLQLGVVDPAVLAIFSFHSVPVGSSDQNYNLGSRAKRFEICGRMERSGLQLRSLRLDNSFHLSPQRLDLLLRRTRRQLRARHECLLFRSLLLQGL